MFYISYVQTINKTNLIQYCNLLIYLFLQRGDWFLEWVEKSLMK